jgi:hypothetical protein
MDPIKTPFSPGAGSPPPELAGRAPVLEQARILLGRVFLGKSEKSLKLTGPRGVGKTVLLNEVRCMAQEIGYRTVLIQAHQDKALGPLIAAPLKTVFSSWIGLPRRVIVSNAVCVFCVAFSTT